MIEWNQLTEEQKRDYRRGMSRKEQEGVQQACHHQTLRLLVGDAEATQKAWRVTWGNYYINTPEQIATQCKKGGLAERYDEQRVKVLKKMLAYETAEGKEHFGAQLGGWWDGETISIDAGGLRALINYYSDVGKESADGETA